MKLLILNNLPALRQKTFCESLYLMFDMFGYLEILVSLYFQGFVFILKEAKDGLTNCAQARLSADPKQRTQEAMQDPEVQVDATITSCHQHVS